MFFVEVKNDEFYEDDESNNDCIICLDEYHEENNEETKEYTFLLKNYHQEIVKNCDCNCKIHNNCLESWLLNKNNCIICRTNFDSEYLNNEEYNMPNGRMINIYKIAIKTISCGLILCGISYFILKK
jgi:hypothetical protein